MCIVFYATLTTGLTLMNDFENLADKAKEAANKWGDLFLYGYFGAIAWADAYVRLGTRELEHSRAAALYFQATMLVWGLCASAVLLPSASTKP